VPAFRHLLATVPFPVPLQFVHLVLSEFQNSPKTLVINDLPLVDTFQFVEHLIFE
jgi:hypothetical protein